MGEPVQRERPKKDFPQNYASHDIIGYLLDNAGELSKAHGKIAEAILHHPTMFVEKPIEDLVTWLGVSAPTITRFSRAIGCDGLRDLLFCFDKISKTNTIIFCRHFRQPMSDIAPQDE